MRELLPLVVVGAWGLWAAPAQAGVRIESQVTAYEGQPVDTVLELQGDGFRVDRHDSAQPALPHTTIFDGERMLLVNDTDKSYSEKTLADLAAQLAKLEKMKGSLPPQAREMMDRAGTPPEYGFKRTSGGEKVAGIPCENYQITKDGQDEGTACLAPWKASGPLTKGDLAPMRKLIEVMKSLSRLSAGDLEMGQFDQWPGWPLVMRAHDGHELSRVVSIKRMSFPATDFRGPGGIHEEGPVPVGPDCR